MEVERHLVLELLEEAVQAGARQDKACEVLGISGRTVQRWRREGLEDRRRGPRSEPSNKLSKEEREEVLQVVNTPVYRDLSPSQIVPHLADEGIYLASESTMYRILREEDQVSHRERSKAPEKRPVVSHAATGPNQVWSWDIERHEALLNLAVVKDHRPRLVAAGRKKLRAA